MKKILKTKILSFTLGMLFIASPVFASGPFLPEYYHTPEDLNTIQFLEYNNDYNAIDTPNQIVFEGLEEDQLLPLYRKLIGKPFSSEVKKALYYVDYKDPNYSYKNDTYKSPSKIWREARDKIMKDGVVGGDDYYDNCADDTYTNAVATLNNRKSKYSKSELREWIKNQDAVFAECRRSASGDYNARLEKEKSLAIAFTNQIPASSKSISDIETPPAPLPEHKGFFMRIGDFFVRLYQNIFHRNTFKNVSEDSPVILNTCTSGVCLLNKKYEGPLQYDYEYQQALQSSYTLDLIRTESYLKTIAGNTEHPWSMQATYLLGGFYIEQYQAIQFGSLKATDYKKEKDTFLSLASEQYNKILANKAWSTLHHRAQGMLDYILGQNDPFADFEKQTKILETSQDPVLLKEAIDNYLTLFPEEKEVAFKDKILKEGDNLSQWVYMWKYPQTADLALIQQKYKETHNDAWLLALARFIQPTDSSFEQIKLAVQKLPTSSLAYWNANYYIIKKTIDAGKIDTAKTMLDKLDTSKASNGVADYIIDLKMRSASSVTQLFSYSGRHIYEVAGTYTNQVQNDVISKIPFMDNKAKAIFETKLPLAEQVKLLSSDTLFTKKQTEFLRLTAFVRAVLLKDWKNADILANQLAKNNSEIQADLSTYLNAKTNEDKEYGGVYLMSNYVGIGVGTYDDVLIDESIDALSNHDFEVEYSLEPRSNYQEASDYNGNRWTYCQPIKYIWKSDIKDDGTDYGYDKEIPVDTKYYDYDIGFVDRIISKENQSKAKEELQKIYGLDNNYFPSVILNYAKSHTKEPTLPRALYQIVRFSKFGDCRDGNTSSVSKKAFQLLHSKYPTNEWTKKTPYYY